MEYINTTGMRIAKRQPSLIQNSFNRMGNDQGDTPRLSAAGRQQIQKDYLAKQNQGSQIIKEGEEAFNRIAAGNQEGLDYSNKRDSGYQPWTQQESLDDENENMALKEQAQKLYSDATNQNVSKFMSEREKDKGLNALNTYKNKRNSSIIRKMYT